ncbi:MAG: cytochrome C peroxidase [Gemmatimonadaceae bacterium]|nr:cytochrome C peroxidase [Chitinophagaceae bacterium]
MKKTILIAILVAISVMAVSFVDKRKTDAEKAANFFFSSLSRFENDIKKLEKLSNGNRNEVQKLFRETRIDYKKVEIFIAYFSPLTESSINGPALRSVDDPLTPEEEAPHGLQVLEELYFSSEGPLDSISIRQECFLLKDRIKQFLEFRSLFAFNQGTVTIAAKQQLIRIVSLGISGFDSPTAAHSIPEAASALSALQKILSFYRWPPSVTAEQTRLFQNGIAQLSPRTAFEDFDRVAFIKNIANPLYKNIATGNTDNPEGPADFSAKSFLSESFFRPSWYLQSDNKKPSKEKIALGRKLFFDPLVSGDAVRSCASCHNPAKGFTDGLPKSLNMDNLSTTTRNAPTLWNAALQPFQFLDMRANTLGGQLDTVLNNHAEMGTSLSETVTRVRKSSAYQKLFENSFGSADSINPTNVKIALGSYIQTLISFNSPFDKFLRNETSTLDRAAYNGFNLFMGKAKCGTCHFVPLYSGVVPPRFVKMESEVIGVPAIPDTVNSQLDKDPGRYGHMQFPVFHFAFKTPTLRNIALTAPYMHNGVYKTLEEVIDFYNRGGGKGLGIGPDHQTLPFDELSLTENEQKNIVSFLKTLTDTSAVH